jgi:hypothetical protein
MDRTLLVKCDPAVKVTCCTKEVYFGLPIIALVGIVYLGLNEK